jgi:hypothetical protein
MINTDLFAPLPVNLRELDGHVSQVCDLLSLKAIKISLQRR